MCDPKENYKYPLISKWINQIEDSVTLALNAKAKELMAQGKEIISFAAGEPDFDTPQHIKNGAIQALQQGYTKYTPSQGLKPLRDAIVSFHKKLHEINNITAEHVIVSSGAKQALILFLQVVLDPGDKVLIPIPYWLTYPQQVKIAQGEPIFIQTEKENNYKLTPQLIRSNYKRGTKVIIINNPLNPTGIVYTEDELYQIMEVCKELGLWVLADEIYSELCFDDTKFVSMLKINERIGGGCVAINGVSKTFSMTGWRVGWAIGPVDIIEKMKRLVSHTTSCVTSISQYGAIAALQGELSFLNEWKTIFRERRDTLIEELSKDSHIEFIKPLATFYLMANFNYYINNTKLKKTLNSTYELCNYLIEKGGIVLVPGDEFGLKGWCRFTFAIDKEKIRVGIANLLAILKELL